MRKALKTVHMLGLSVFLGSIAVYIAFSTQHLVPGTPAFAQLREQIFLGTRCLTLPGLLVTLASGLGLLWVNRRQLQRWQIAKAVVGSLLLFNTWLLVEPAIKSVAILSTVTIFSQENIGELAKALKTETVAGALNVAFACLEIWLAVFRPSLRRRQMDQPSLVVRSQFAGNQASTSRDQHIDVGRPSRGVVSSSDNDDVDSAAKFETAFEIHGHGSRKQNSAS